SKETTRNDTGSAGTLIQGAGSISQIGGSGNQATINNIGVEPPLPNVTWTSTPVTSKIGNTFGVALELMVDRPFSNPTFWALCDRPCASDGGAIKVEGAMFQTQPGWDENN